MSLLETGFKGQDPLDVSVEGTKIPGPGRVFISSHKVPHPENYYSLVVRNIAGAE